MISRTSRKSTISQMAIWVVMVAFCLCLFAPSAFPRSRPYDIKTVTHVQKETDDGGWINPATQKKSDTRPQPVDPPSNRIVAHSGVFAHFTVFLTQLWISIIDQPQPPVEPQTKESAQW